MFIYSKNEVYSTKYFLYTYGHNCYRIVKINSCRNEGFEEIKNDNDFVDVNSDEVKRISLSRTKRNIREICLCNDFTYFVTLTIDSKKADRYSLDSCQNLLKKLLKKIKRKYPNFIYIFITEKHKDGAFHFHGLIGGVTNEFFYTNVNGYLSCDIFSEFLGYNSFSIIKDYVKCSNYILKYITKDCVKNSHNQIYISSRGLKKATREDFDFFEFTPTYSNDYVEIQDLCLDDMTFDEKLNFFNKFKGNNEKLTNI